MKSKFQTLVGAAALSLFCSVFVGQNANACGANVKEVVDPAQMPVPGPVQVAANQQEPSSEHLEALRNIAIEVTAYDPPEVLLLLEKANQGDQQAMISLCYLLPYDDRRAFYWCGMTYQLDDRCRTYLGVMYYHGYGVEENKQYGLRLIRASAKNGEQEARLALVKLGLSNGDANRDDVRDYVSSSAPYHYSGHSGYRGSSGHSGPAYESQLNFGSVYSHYNHLEGAAAFRSFESDRARYYTGRGQSSEVARIQARRESRQMLYQRDKNSIHKWH